MKIELKFSASRASKYHNCHASANLAEAIPGFEVRGPERAAAVSGTNQHTIFESVLLHSTNMVEGAGLLRDIADVFGKNRTAILQDEREYITWWFMKERRDLVLEHKYISSLVYPIQAKNKPATKTKPAFVAQPGDTELFSTSPKSIRFLAEAVEYVQEILLDGGELLTEEKTEATWLTTKPKTTVDVLIRQGKTLHVLDLKTGTLPVEVMNNEQLMHYAMSFLRDEETIVLHIMQVDNLVEWTISRAQLLAWAEEVKESERAILAGDLTFNPGSYCGFCPANPTSSGERGFPSCPARVELLFGTQDDAASDEDILIDD